MKLNLRFLLILPMLAVFCTISAFWEFVFGSLVDQEPEQLRYLNYALLAGSLAAIFLYWRYLQPIIKVWFGVWVLVIGWLMLESYAGWDSWLQYPHVFNKFFVLLLGFGLYAFHRRFGLPPFRMLMNTVFFVLVLNLVALHPDSLSLSAFVDNDRGFNSGSAYILVLVLLFNLNYYLRYNTLSALLILFLCFR